MTDVQTLPRPEGLSERPDSQIDRDGLIEQLDQLLEKYLETLDEYQKAQQQLAKFLSSGYLSLAQANFSNSSRTRFGQDYYDERMQAQRKVSVTAKQDIFRFSVSGPTPDVPSPEVDGTAGSENTRSARASEAPVGTAGESPEQSEGADAQNEKSDEEAKSAGEKVSTDSIRWFGILVPPALRAAQASFVSAVEEPVPRVATLIKELRKQEIDIGRLRKQIKKL
ncbi:hypothetical protein BS50DRAFT_571617 [Corynespora cassiicola Philippines]|uniref:Vacuolar ATPase assembly protein VMA22 n=1 Tax=Corynespora cassiicola Philippines TaxID=1448308 RepID=A0A2T2NY63_CORCC|nr:hypothetical protein BS50DRAFT_571617 [Corynespora cassiicola Philippines]